MALDPTKTAFLTLDIQDGLIEKLAEPEGFLANAAKAVAFARSKHFTLIHVGLGFAAGHPEVSGVVDNAFLRAKQQGLYVKGTAATRIHAAVFAAGDLVVHKHRVSAFSENELLLVLRARAVDTLVLLGVATGGVVLATLARAYDLDFRLVVLADACFDPDPEVHRVLTTKIFAKRGKVVDVDAFIAEQEEGGEQQGPSA